MLAGSGLSFSKDFAKGGVGVISASRPLHDRLLKHKFTDRENQFFKRNAENE